MSVSNALDRTCHPIRWLTDMTGYVPGTYGHYVENTGNTTLRFLEVFKSEKFEDISLNQVSFFRPDSPMDFG